MKHLLTSLLLACALSVLAVTPTGLGLSNVATVAAATPPASGSSFLLEEGFEGTGFENTWTTAGSGTIDPDETTVVLVGSESLQFILSGAAGSSYVEFAGQSSLFCKFRFRVASTNGGNQSVVTIRNGSTVLGTLTLAGANRSLRTLAAGGANANSTDVLPLNTDVYVWFEYVAGTGSNAICRAGWATTDSKPALTSTAGKTALSSNGTATASATRLYLGNTNSGVVECFFDAVQVSASAF
jgi:hypothetical protein